MTFTLNEISLILIALGIGIVVGLMISGRGKYKRLWREEQFAHQQTINASSSTSATPTAARGMTVPASRTTAVKTRERDDLTRIRTISAKDERTLNEAGYHHYGQIAALSDEQQATLEARLGHQPGLIAHDEWREQARLLDDGHLDEHERRYNPRKTAV